MSRRWVWWTGGGLLVLLLLLLGWLISLEVPDQFARAERSLHDAASRYGLRIGFANLKFHPLHLRVSLDNLVVIDGIAGVGLATAGSVDVSISPFRFLAGDIPVSRIRIRDFRFQAGEANRALYEKLTSAKGEGSGGSLPEILLVDGSVRLGPLGPVRRFEATIRELRVREVRFLGLRTTVTAERASGEIEIPGAGPGAWPYASLEAEILHKDGVFRVRRLRAAGDGSAVRLSGVLDARKETVDGKLSGDVDLARWVAAGAPGARFVRGVVREGKADFSATVSGPWSNPRGTGKFLLRGAAFAGIPPMDGEAELSLEGRVVRLARLQAKLWGGALDASGRYDLAAGKGEGKADLRRVSLHAVPWDAFGVPGRLSGTGNLSVRVEGTPDRVRGDVSLSLPQGLERVPGTGESGVSLRIPLSADVSGELRKAGEVRIDSFRVQAGRAETRGEGGFSLPDGRLRASGTVTVPSGKAADYGWAYPLSWGSAEGTWEISGPVDRLRTVADLRVDALAVRSLPPLPLRLKADGMPSDALHFAADVPARSLKVTAVGTVTSPLAPSRSRAEVTFTAREVDLSEGSRWVAAVADLLGKEAGELPRYLAGAEGMAEGDMRLVLTPGLAEFSGSARSRRLSVRGIPFRDVKAEGRYGISAESPSWSGRGEAGFGDGAVRIEARGAAGGMEITGAVDRLEIARVLSLLNQGNVAALGGTVEARFAVKEGPGGWEVPRFVAETKGLSVGEVRFEGVRAEGTLGIPGGTFSAVSTSPRLTLAGEIRRGGGWPVKFSLAAADVPTSFLLTAAGHPGIASDGEWQAEAGGVVLVGDLVDGKKFGAEAIPTLHAIIRSAAPSVGDFRFEECRATGRREGEKIVGEVETRLPDTRLSWSLSLREPFGFRVEGPFSLGGVAGAAATKDEKRQYSLRGRVEAEGSLRALEKSTGTVQVETLAYREGGLEVVGKDLSARLDPEGFRLTGGSIVTAGNPVKISGKVSWTGELDVRVDGKLPASVVRLVVPGVFDRLDGMLTLGVRLTGKAENPTIIGTGHVEGATLSFTGYAQVFDSIRADTLISREKIVFEHFEGRSGGGYIDGWGEVPLKMDAGQRLYFSVDFLDLRYPYPEDFRPVIQGHAELMGPVDDLLVTGDVEVLSARYTRNMYPERALMDFSKRLSDVAARREKSDFRVRLDINVVADRTVRIKNNLVDAKASGEFKVEGNTGKVVILGSFDVYEGYVEFYGNRYELKRVTVDFQDPRRNNPRLDARAETRKGSYNVTVTVSGTLEKPEVDFSSDPPLGRTDIVSLLSFGVTTQNLASPGTGATSTSGAVGAAAITVGSSAGGVDEKIRGAVGLDRFAIETGFSETSKSFEPRFVVGKSFGDRATVSLSTSVGTSAETSASGELRLYENVYLQGAWQSTTSSSNGDISGDLKVRYRYPSLKDLVRGRE